MRNRLAIVAVVLALIGLGAWWWTSSAGPVPSASVQAVQVAPKPVRVQRTGVLPADAPEPDDELLVEAARGEHGLEMRNRVCGLCADGRLADEDVCRPCGEIAAAGRVHVDLVGTDGRPIPDFDGMIVSSCGHQAAGQSGSLDLAAGDCELFPVVFDGAIAIRGNPVAVEVVVGEEQYQLLEVPSGPHGGAGLMLQTTDDGVAIGGLIAGTAALDAGLEVGALLVSVDGEPMHDLALPEVLDRLVGPRGTEVTVTVENSDGELEEVVLDRREIRGQQLQGLQGQPG